MPRYTLAVNIIFGENEERHNSVDDRGIASGQKCQSCENHDFAVTHNLTVSLKGRMSRPLLFSLAFGLRLSGIPLVLRGHRGFHLGPPGDEALV